MKIYVMRHGQTVWNAMGITQGRSQNRLSQSGKMQAEMTAEKAKNIKFDLIICSPLMRTVQTANIMNKYHNVKIVKNEKINENDQGIFTRRKYSTLTEEEKMLKEQRAKIAKMESIEEIESRTKAFIEEVKEKYAEKVILVVTHNIVASAIEAVSKNVKFSEYAFRNLFSFKNAELREIEI